jgi:hypothetical protein
MKRKRDILTRKVLKYKARLNVHGGKQEYAVNFFKTYSPVVTWAAVWLMTTFAWLNNWHTIQCDFVLAYPQATVEFDLYMELPKGIQLSSGNRKTHVLLLIKNFIWPEASRKSVEPAPSQRSAESWGCSLQGGCIYILQRQDHIHSLCG